MFNLYVSDTKKKTMRLSTFPGLSLGEVRSFLLDLFVRDLRNEQYTQISKTLSQQMKDPIVTVEDISDTSKRIEDILYDEMNTQQILTTIWGFSDKTIIIVKAN